MPKISPAASLIFLVGLPLSAAAQQSPGPGVSQLDVVQVTANRFAEPVQEVPDAISVIGGEELRARGVNDLRTALALVGGVTVQPGGDDGPTGSSPALLGTRESDDFLLVVDGVPSGGAFVPQFATIDLHNVERIEVQRGAAPVFYGTTAFAGTINIVHYPAGSAESVGSVSYGSYGSAEVGGSGVISTGAIRQSVSADLDRERYSDSHEAADRAHLLYRAATEIAGGDAQLDFDSLVQHQKPSSPMPLDDVGITHDLPIDFNQNPADGKIDTNRFQLTAAYDKSVHLGSWGSTLSFTQTQSQKVQGFLSDDFEAAADDDSNATGFHARQHLSEVFFDTHLTSRIGKLAFTYGINELYGLAHQTSDTFDYRVATDGSGAQGSGDVAASAPNTLTDIRSFLGAYVQARWAVTRDIGILAGLRLNHTDEQRAASGVADTADDDATTIVPADDGGGGDGGSHLRQSYHTTRPSGSIGANWRVWNDVNGDLDDVTLYASFSNTFQQPELDFGPDDGFEPLLKPETQKSFETGIKADGFDGRFDLDLSAFLVGFGNQTIAVDNNGTPGVAAGGSERYSGFEIETSYLLLPDLRLSGHSSYNDSRYRNFSVTDDDGDLQQLSGNHLPLSAQNLGGLGLIYARADHLGFNASATGSYVGGRYLDMANSLRTPSYITADASLGYQFRRVGVLLTGYNLSNRRDPVLESELGDSRYYLLQGRRFFVKLLVPLGANGIGKA